MIDCYLLFEFSEIIFSNHLSVCRIPPPKYSIPFLFLCIFPFPWGRCHFEAECEARSFNNDNGGIPLRAMMI